MAPDTDPKRVEFLKLLNPRLTRLAVLCNPDNPSHRPMLSITRQAASTRGVEVFAVEGRDGEGIERALELAAQERAQAILVSEDATFNGQTRLISRSALANRLSSIGTTPEFAEGGGLLGYGVSIRWVWRRTADFVDKILRGARPSELPFEQPMRLELAIKAGTARALGLVIPPELHILADKVID